MRLKDRLRELQGEKVKIGGSVGFFYCGDVFDGLETLVDDIGEAERYRLERAEAVARNSYENWEQMYEDRKNQHRESIRHEEEIIRELEVLPNTYKESLSNANYYLQIVESDYWKDYFLRYIDFLNDWKRQWTDLWNQELRPLRDIKKRIIDRNQKILATMDLPATRKRWKESAKRKYEKIKEEVESYTVFSETEITDEYMAVGAWEYGTRIIILKSAIQGKYWDESECKADSAFQSRVRRAKNGHMDDF